MLDSADPVKVEIDRGRVVSAGGDFGFCAQNTGCGKFDLGMIFLPIPHGGKRLANLCKIS